MITQQEVGDHHQESATPNKPSTHDDDSAVPERRTYRSVHGDEKTTNNRNTRHPRHQERRRSTQHTEARQRKRTNKHEGRTTTQKHMDGKHDTIIITMGPSNTRSLTNDDSIQELIQELSEFTDQHCDFVTTNETWRTRRESRACHGTALLIHKRWSKDFKEVRPLGSSHCRSSQFTPPAHGIW